MTNAPAYLPASRRPGLTMNWFLARADDQAPARVLAGRQARSPCGSPCPSNFSRSTRRRSRSVLLGGLIAGYPDFWNYSNRDYGARIGIYRIMRVLDGFRLRATAAVNAAAVHTISARRSTRLAVAQMGVRGQRHRHGPCPPRRPRHRRRTRPDPAGPRRSCDASHRRAMMAGTRRHARNSQTR